MLELRFAVARNFDIFERKKIFRVSYFRFFRLLSKHRRKKRQKRRACTDDPEGRQRRRRHDGDSHVQKESREQSPAVQAAQRFFCDFGNSRLLLLVCVFESPHLYSRNGGGSSLEIHPSSSNTRAIRAHAGGLIRQGRQI